jgi:hypothetical protein
MGLTETVQGVAQKAILDIVKKKITEVVVKQLVWFGAPPLSWVLGYFLGKFLPILINEGMLHLKYFGIEAEVNLENEAAKEAKVDLEKAIAGGNKDEISKAKENFKNKYSDLISMRP